MKTYEQLVKEFDEKIPADVVATRLGGRGMKLSYLEGHYVIDRLNKTSVRSLIDRSNVDQHCYHKFVIEVDSRDILQRNLALRKIETKVHYKDPIQDLPAYQQCQGPDMMSASHALSRRCLSLPIYPELTDLEVEYVIDQVLDCVA
jgi:dTDP-4-amino-4,6-dideoxygalactose transaminase